MAVQFIKKRLTADYLILSLLLFFVFFGLLIVYSSTTIISFKRFGSDTHFVTSHLFHLFAGALVGLGCACIKLEWLKKYTYLFLILGILGLCLPLIPGLQVSLGGASRWIRLAGFHIQPSEFCKIPLLLYLAYSLNKKIEKKTIHLFAIGTLPHLGITAIMSVLLLLEPDFGTALLYISLLLFMLFMAGTPLKHLIGLSLAALPFLVGVIYMAPYRLKRILTFLNPWSDPGNKGFQTLQALTSFSSGNIFGKGLGNSQGKLFFIPQAHSDYVFSIMGEEIGFFGILIFLTLWSLFIFRGFWITRHVKEPFVALLTAGATFILMTQSLIHIMVNIALLPPTGMNLPFISTGGSNVILCMALVGLLLNCSTYVKR